MSEYEQKMLRLFQDFVVGQKKIISLLERLVPPDKDEPGKRVSTPGGAGSPGTGWVDRLDVVRIFRSSESTIKRWTKDGLLEGVRIGRKVWYLESELFNNRKNLPK